MRWGTPSPPRMRGAPVTNIRNTSSPHWRMWLKPENRCLVPANSFADYAPEPNLETKKKDVVAGLGNRPRSAFRAKADPGGRGPPCGGTVINQALVPPSTVRFAPVM
jgi:hypothetical protein